MHEAFSDENFVIITSNKAISAREWTMYLVENWDKLTKKNSKIVVMVGIHGYQDGRLGHVDKGLLSDNKGQIRILERKFATQMEEDNIEIVLEDVGEHMNSSQLYAEKMVEAVKLHKPTIIILAFCWTNNSDLNPILRASGIYSALLLREERSQIAGGTRSIELDDQQEEVLYEIGRNDHDIDMAFLHGGHGTGKTLLGVEAAKIMAEKCKAEGKNATIYVMINDLGRYRKPIHLEENIKEVHFKNQENINFRRMSEIIGENADAEDGIKNVEKILEEVNKDEDSEYKIILIDEGLPNASGSSLDWTTLPSKIIKYDSVKLILCLSPVKSDPSQTTEITAPPSSSSVLSRKLVTRHRSSYNITQLSLFVAAHYPVQRLLSTSTDVIPDKADLPDGPLPTWFDFSGEINYSQLAGEIEGDSLTVIWNDEDTMNQNKESFNTDGCDYKHVYEDHVSGTEAANVLVVNPADFLIHELCSRARNRLYIATDARTHRYAKGVLDKAVAHDDQGYECTKVAGCGYVGQKIINKKML